MDVYRAWLEAYEREIKWTCIMIDLHATARDLLERNAAGYATIHRFVIAMLNDRAHWLRN